MKTLITKFLALSGLAVALLSSCKKDELKVVATPVAGSTTLTLSTTTPALVKANLTTNALTLTGKAQDYGYKAAPTYTFELAVKGTNFAKPTVIDLGTGVFTKTFTVQELNNVLLGLGLKTNTVAQVEIRQKSALSATSGITYSNVGTITATPFALVSYIYVPGAYQGWNPASADSLESATGNGVYTGIINFTAGNLNFKVTPQKKWDVAYGSAGGDKISTSGGDIPAPKAGITQVTVDLNNNTITFGTPAFYFGVIGDATVGGWGTDTDMKYNYATGAWEVTTTLVASGKFKVRLNHDWGTSFGLPATPDGKTLTSANGGDIPVPSNGTYKITFTPTYTVEGQTTKVNATAAYTLVKQ
ncbi:SusE domain-containing protein [Mucilaginibacter myungsuensis]|uniref:SusE domain-containing protein n=1 Tax=Mucilaginibacter myungsuensis TaxID=649104 RepID=A0A929L1W9_9SPHI|nr:SusE domain-containing protein [Mucilaginibacter myungsuensis]MBE9664103.1 SusE domain-containing protein [Mucilaginibacter myungsuensis]MDN3601282.1 SusE domain-containing protein [Mucilaginibacter myungsuensis]